MATPSAHPRPTGRPHERRQRDRPRSLRSAQQAPAQAELSCGKGRQPRSSPPLGLVERGCEVIDVHVEDVGEHLEVASCHVQALVLGYELDLLQVADPLSLLAFALEQLDNLDGSNGSAHILRNILHALHRAVFVKQVDWIADLSQAGRLDALLDDRDRALDPDNTGGTYAPNVRPMKHVRARVVLGGTTYPLYS